MCKFLLLFLVVLTSVYCETSLDGANKLSDTVGLISTYTHDESHSRNFTRLTRISHMLEIFDLNEIGEGWSYFSGELGKGCAKSMGEYLRGLEAGLTWAIKMDDASGHYTTGFFYGNNYFTGSLSLCKTIYQDDQNVEATAEASPLHNTNPPFHPSFFMLRVSINESRIAPNERTIHVGICLPSTCSLDEVAQLAQFTQQDNNERNITVMAVRSPTQTQFDLWNDTTFVILIVVTFVVTILLIWGTIYDILLTSRFKQLEKEQKAKELDSESSSTSGIGCTTYDLTSAVPNKTSLSVGINIPRGVNNNQSDENLAITTKKHSDNLSVFSELLLSFSVITNFKAICDKHVGADTLSSLHGIRAISMGWVILGHTCIIVFKYSDNMELRKVVEKEFMFQTITNGAFSVDSFFFISGLLVSYIYFRTNAKGNLEKLTKGANEFLSGVLHFLGLICYRFLRLTAPYLYVLGVVEVTMKYFAHSSVFEPPTLDHVNCPNYWWRNVLYINTLFPNEEMCMLWSWYLADDTQFYIIGAIILIIAVRHFKLAATIMGVIIASSWVTTASIAFTHNHMPNTDDPLALFDKIYDKPWTRIGPYLVGMSVGWILFKWNCKIKMNKTTVAVGWTLSASCILFLIYGLYNTELNALGGAAYSALSHSAWALALAWITIACSTGYGGYINSLLSMPAIYPFSRVTYCAYLVHPLVIRVLALNSDSPLHLGTDSMVIIFFGQAVTSYLLSFVISLAFEAPVVTMLKIVSPNRKKRIN